MTISIHENALLARNIHLSFQALPLFHHFNIEFPLGKCTCILGPSGTGKTTLLRHIEKSAGAEIAAQIAFLSQENALLPWLNTLENTILQSRLRQLTRQENVALTNEATALLQQLGLEKALHLYPHELSGGMRQRVALARTFLEKKSIILMDEPFSALDAITRFNLQTTTTELLRGKTTILVTHDPLEALRMADHIYVLGGFPVRIVESIKLDSATPRELKNDEVVQHHAILLQELANAQAA